jgi:WD40 repeat protein
MEGKIMPAFLTTDKIMNLLKEDIERPSSKQFTTVSPVTCLKTTENYIFAGLKSGAIYIIDQKNSSGSKLIQAHGREVTDLTLSSDKKGLISCSMDDTIRIWDLEKDYVLKRSVNAHSLGVNGIARLFDDVNIASAGVDSKIKLWNEEFDCVGEVVGHHGPVSTICSSRMFPIFVSGGQDKEIKIWDCLSHNSIGTLVGHKSTITCLVLSKSNNFLVSGSEDNSVRIWDMKTRLQLKCLKSSDMNITAVKMFMNDKYILTGSDDSRLVIWSLDSYAQVANISAHDDTIQAIAVSKYDRSIITGGLDSKIISWDIDGKIYDDIYTIPSGTITSSCITIDNKYLIIGNSEGKLSIWNMHKKTEEDVMVDHNSAITCVLSSNTNAFIISADSLGSIKIWNMMTRKHDYDIVGHVGAVLCIVLSKNQHTLYSSSADRTIKVWDLETRACTGVMAGHFGKVYSICISEMDGILISGSSDKRICIWNLHSRNLIYQLIGHHGKVYSITFNSDTKTIISASSDGSLKLWNSKNYELEGTLTGHTDNVIKLQVVNSGRFLISASTDRTVKVWSLIDHGLISSADYGKEISSISYSYNDCFIGIASNRFIKIMTNPLDMSSPLAIIPKNESYIFLRKVNLILNKQEHLYDDSLANYCIYPWRINILHILAYVNRADLIERAIRAGAKFIKSFNGDTPLLISLSGGSQQCVDILLKGMTSELLQAQPRVLNYVENLLPRLNLMSPNNLELIYKAMYPECNDIRLPKLGCPARIPLVMRSETDLINPSLFMKSKFEVLEKYKEEFLIFRRSLIKFPLEPGSLKGVQFLRSLEICSNTEVFDTPIIAAILDYRWRQVRSIIWAFVMIRIGQVTFLLLHTIYTRTNRTILSLLICFNTFDATFEVLQLMDSVPRYFKNFWNYIDLIRIILMYVYIISVFAGDIGYVELLPYVLLFLWLRMIVDMSIFEKARYLLSNVVEIVYVILPYLIIPGTAVLTFGLCYYVNGNGDRTVGGSFLHVYNLSLGETNPEGYSDLDVVIFVLATISNPLILLNLLVGIMGDTYQRSQRNFRRSDKIRLTNMILEVESILLWKRKYEPTSFIHQCATASYEVENYTLNNSSGVISAQLDSGQTLEERLEVLRKDVLETQTMIKDGFANLKKEILEEMQIGFQTWTRKELKSYRDRTMSRV